MLDHRPRSRAITFAPQLMRGAKCQHLLTCLDSDKGLPSDLRSTAGISPIQAPYRSRSEVCLKGLAFVETVKRSIFAKSRISRTIAAQIRRARALCMDHDIQSNQLKFQRLQRGLLLLQKPSCPGYAAADPLIGCFERRKDRPKPMRQPLPYFNSSPYPCFAQTSVVYEATVSKWVEATNLKISRWKAVVLPKEEGRIQRR